MPATEQALGADSPMSGLLVKLRGRAAQAQRSAATCRVVDLIVRCRDMKKTAFLIALLLVVSQAQVSAKRNIAWNPKERPRLQLPQAMKLASEALNAKEGLPAQDPTFYCLNSWLAITTSKDGDWTFRFGSKESGERLVIVDLDGRVDVRKDAPFY
jgi:hypothetical protein